MKALKNALFHTALLASFVCLTGCPQQPLKKMTPEEAARVGAQPPVYDAPDTVGTLGGRKVRMNSYQIQDVSYTDTPGFFSDNWKDYQAPPRTYDSQLRDFGFYMDYRKGAILDPRFDDHFYKEGRLPDSPWVLVGVQSNNETMNRPDIWNTFLERDLEVKPELPAYNYIKIPEVQYGLQRYIVPGHNPKTGKTWRLEHSDARDLFIAFDKNGNVRSYIKCANNTDVPNPPCSHIFRIMQDGLKVTVKMGYSRHSLQNWQKIEKAAANIIWSFVKNAEDDLKNQQSTNENRSK